MITALENALVFDGDTFVGLRTVTVVDGRIADILPDGAVLPANAHFEDLGGQMLVPGFVDVQVNGGGDVMFNSERSVDGLRKMAEGHRRYGTTSMMPTLITDEEHVMAEAVEAIRSALSEGVPGIRGVHFEGPCLAPARKGTHDESLFRPLDQGVEAIYLSEGLGRVIVTLAPEQVPAETITRLTEKGILVSAGHTAANYDQARAGLDAGIRSFTHLYNAMTPMQGREPGVVGCALDDAESWCGLIVDGYHLHAVTARNAVRSKAVGKIMLITDAMGTVGGAEKSFVLYGKRIHAVDGRCAHEDGTLAGSDLDMMSAVRNAHQMLGLPLGEALRMASLYPASFLKLEDRIGRIAPGYEADFAVIDSETLTVSRTYIAGVGKDAA